MVTILTERRCKPGKEEEFKKLSLELRAKVIFASGFYSAETLRSTDDPLLFLIIHTWMSVEQWEAWRNSPVRQEVIRNIEALLVETEKDSVFQPTDLAEAP